jgi:hypothetical protein
MVLTKLSSHTSALLLTGLLLLAFYVYGSLYFYRDPGSVFFDQSRAFERRYSAYREAEAIAFKEEAIGSLANDPEGLRSWKAGEGPSICGAFITIARGDELDHPLEVCNLF